MKGCRECWGAEWRGAESGGVQRVAGCREWRGAESGGVLGVKGCRGEGVQG